MNSEINDIDRPEILSARPEVALDNLRVSINKRLDVVEKLESNEYKTAVENIKNNLGDINRNPESNLRAISKILGADVALVEHRDLAIKALKEIPSDEFSKWVEGNEKMAEPLRALPASVLLSPGFANPARLRALFMNSDEIDFHGNSSARNYLGAGDLFGSENKFIKIDGVVGIRSIDSKFNKNKIGYIDEDGDYLAVLGGEKISFDVDAEEKEGFSDAQIDNDLEYKLGNGTILSGEEAYRAYFTDNVDDLFIDEEQRIESIKTEINIEGLDNIDKPSGRKFFEMSKLVALELEAQTGVPWQVTVAQALLESAHGKSGLAKKSKNYFGIKGPGKVYETKERYNGVTKKVKDSFREYNKFSDSFVDHDNLFLSQKRYQEVMRAYENHENFKVSPDFVHPTQKGYKGVETRPLKTPADFLWGVIESGYATADTKEYLRGAESVLKRYGESLGELSPSV